MLKNFRGYLKLYIKTAFIDIGIGAVKRQEQCPRQHGEQASAFFWLVDMTAQNE